jgi:hypothetical protein
VVAMSPERPLVRLKHLGYIDTNFGRLPTWRVLCGSNTSCRGEFGMAIGPAHRVDGSVCCSLELPAGFAERFPAEWALGNHARRSERQAPRRPRYTGVPSGQSAPGYLQGGTYMIRGPHGKPDIPALAPTDAQGRRMSAPQHIMVAQGDELLLTCPRCQQRSRLRSEFNF